MFVIQFFFAVMQDTGCHIHFPDSNRGTTNEKSNQVGHCYIIKLFLFKLIEVTKLIFGVLHFKDFLDDYLSMHCIVNIFLGNLNGMFFKFSRLKDF